MILVNTEIIPGKRMEKVFGLVSGSTIRAKHIGRDIIAGIKNIFGGKLEDYTELLEDSRKEATLRMITQAQQIGANAIINVRFSTSSITAGAAEIYVYGTTVFVR